MRYQSLKYSFIKGDIPRINHLYNDDNVIIFLSPHVGAEHDDTSMTTLEGYNIHPLTGYTLICQQFWAVILKRFYYIRRNWRSLFSQILLPALFVCIAMTVALTAPRVSNIK